MTDYKWHYRRRLRRTRSFWLVFATLMLAAGALAISLGGRTNNESGLSRNGTTARNASTAPGQIIQWKRLASLSATAVDNDVKLAYGEAGLLPAKTGIETYQFTYASTDARNGGSISVVGRAYIPSTGTNLPGIVFGPGTTGPGPLCAPSLERTRVKNWGRYDNDLSFYAGQGYAVVTTDYDNRTGSNAISHYFVGEMEGRAMLDAARALRNLRDPDRFSINPVGKQMFMSGYSQGGHAALWADKLRQSYAPDVTIAGIFSFAPATDLTRTLVDTINGSATIWLPPYLIAAYDDYYKLSTPALTYFQEPYAGTLESDARSYCIDQLEVRTGRYGTSSNVDHVYQPALVQALRGATFATSFDELARLLERNLAGDQKASAPVLTIAGDKDVVILPAAQTELTKRLCTAGTQSVQLEEYPGITHYTAMSKGRERSLSWMHQVLSGETMSTDCGKYL